MKNFYLTFGAQYSHEPHPQGAHVHPDGYVLITASDYDIARDMVTQLYGRAWSDLYEEDHFCGEWNSDDVAPMYLFSRGELLRIVVPS